MKTWILVMLTSAYIGNNISTQPGFTSIEECQSSAAAYRAGALEADPPIKDRVKAFCIPGPTKTSN